MKKILILTIVLSLICAGINVSSIKVDKGTNEEIENEQNYYAVIVGIEEFSGLERHTQEYLDESATKIYERLIESPNWDEDNILLLLNQNATKDNIHEAVTVWLADKETENDVVLFYVATHGWKTKIKDKIKGNAYFFTYDVTDFAYDLETKITDKELDGWLDVLDSKHIVVMLENCYSGKFLGLRQSGRTIVAAGGKYLFCPCNWSMYLEDTMFGYFLRQGLTGVADINNDGWITVHEAFYYLRVPVIWHSIFYHFPYFYEAGYGLFGISLLPPQIPYMYDRHVGKINFVQL